MYFCSQCLQSHMAPEAKLHYMKCKKCFECPSCQSVLALRAVTTLPEESPKSTEKEPVTPTTLTASATPTTPATPAKKYFLSCGNCYWTTKDAGYEEQELAVLYDSFFDTEQAVIKQLKEAYQVIALRDATEKTAKKSASQTNKRKTMAALGIREDSSSFLSSLSIGTRGMSALNRSKQLANISAVDALQSVMSVATSDVEALPDDYFTRPLDLSNVTTLDQRLRDVKNQPAATVQLKPLRKQLLIKKSVRCKKCDHSLCKPEFSTSNIKFKIQLLAQLQLPEVRIHPGYSLVAGKECEVVLSVSNPDQLSQCTFKLVADNDNQRSNCEITTPSDVEFSLEPKNDAFSLDDSIETDPEKERLLEYNHGSKIGIKCSVNVPGDLAGNAKVCVKLHHTPLLTSTDGSTVSEQQFPICIDLGSVQGF